MICKNCGLEFKENFCSNCGQRKSANDRLRFMSVIQHFLDDQFDLSKGISYTLKYLASKPGEVGRMYIAGKRKRFTNPARFLIIAAALQALIDFLADKDRLIKEYQFYYHPSISEELSNSIEKWSYYLGTEYTLSSTIFFMLLIPLVLNAFFRRPDYNYTELLVVSFYFNGLALISNVLLTFIFRHVFSLYLPNEFLSLTYVLILAWTFVSFYKHIPIIPRILKILGSLAIIVLIRVYLLPLTLSLLFPVS